MVNNFGAGGRRSLAAAPPDDETTSERNRRQARAIRESEERLSMAEATRAMNAKKKREAASARTRAANAPQSKDEAAQRLAETEYASQTKDLKRKRKKEEKKRKKEEKKAAIQLQKQARKNIALNKIEMIKKLKAVEKSQAEIPSLQTDKNNFLDELKTDGKFNVESLIGLLLMMSSGGQGFPGSQEIQELNEQVEEEQPKAQEAIEKMENLMVKLENLKTVVQKESTELNNKKNTKCNCKKSDKAVKELEKAIKVVDVTDALKICQGKLKKYKHHLSNLNDYSAALQKLARDLNTKLEHTIRKSKDCSLKKNKSN